MWCGAESVRPSSSRKAFSHEKRGCEITIVSFSLSFCCGGLAALIGVTGKPYLGCLSYHVCPIRPFRAPSPRGEGCDTRIPSSKKPARNPCEAILSPSAVIPSAAEGSLLHCRHMHVCALTQTTPWCFLFRLSLAHDLPPCKKDLSTSVGMTNRIRIISHSFSYRCVELCLFEALYPAPLARAVWPHRKAP